MYGRYAGGLGVKAAGKVQRTLCLFPTPGAVEQPGRPQKRPCRRPLSPQSAADRMQRTSPLGPPGEGFRQVPATAAMFHVCRTQNTVSARFPHVVQLTFFLTVFKIRVSQRSGGIVQQTSIPLVHSRETPREG